jgi:predicted nucleic acid-binding Zn ribbon protein
MEKKRQRKSESIHIKDVLSDILRHCRTEKNTELAEIRKIWNAILDQTISDNAQPTALKGSILLVTVKSSTLTHQLRFLVQEIITAINQMSGRSRITEIKIKTGTF